MQRSSQAAIRADIANTNTRTKKIGPKETFTRLEDFLGEWDKGLQQTAGIAGHSIMYA